jgi:hypothetical protein
MSQSQTKTNIVDSLCTAVVVVVVTMVTDSRNLQMESCCNGHKTLWGKQWRLLTAVTVTDAVADHNGNIIFWPVLFIYFKQNVALINEFARKLLVRVLCAKKCFAPFSTAAIFYTPVLYISKKLKRKIHDKGSSMISSTHYTIHVRLVLNKELLLSMPHTLVSFSG